MKRVLAAVFLTVIAFSAGREGPARDILTPGERFLELERMFEAYDRALFGSRPYHERMLRLYLWELIHKEIETPCDYVLVISGGAQNKNVRSKFKNRRWLDLIGDIDRESLIDVVSGDTDSIMGWQRSNVLFCVSGRITWARISRNPYGRSVELFFDSIQINRPD